MKAFRIYNTSFTPFILSQFHTHICVYYARPHALFLLLPQACSSQAFFHLHICSSCCKPQTRTEEPMSHLHDESSLTQASNMKTRGVTRHRPWKLGARQNLDVCRFPKRKTPLETWWRVSVLSNDTQNRMLALRTSFMSHGINPNLVSHLSTETSMGEGWPDPVFCMNLAEFTSYFGDARYYHQTPASGVLLVRRFQSHFCTMF